MLESGGCVWCWRAVGTFGVGEWWVRLVLESGGLVFSKGVAF